MRLGLLPGRLTSSGGPSTYVAGVVRGLAEVDPGIQVRPLLLGLRQALPRSRAERRRAADLLGLPGRSTAIGRPVSSRLYASPLAPMMPSYDRLFGRHDVYHQTHLDVDPAVPGRRLVLTLHDVIAERWPDEGRLLPDAERLLGRAAAVITVSEASRAAILSRFPSLMPERVNVVWNGLQHSVFRPTADPGDEARLRAIGLDGPLILYVGGITKRKNVSTLLAAYRLLQAEGSDVPPLVLVGPWPKERVQADGLASIRPLGDVPAATVPALMRRASVVVLPSRDEGFGLPLLEAQACGTLPLCSDIPVFREVGGDAPLYVDSTDSHALAAGMRSALDLDDVERSRRRDLALRHAAGFSWTRSAAGHAEVYTRVAEGSAGGG